MSKIDFDAFVRWAEDRFPGEVNVKGNEVKLNSIFTDDNGHHLWCNPYGGKNSRENGCYRCFKTEERGTLIGLVMRVDSCSAEEAMELLSGQTPIGLLELELDKFFQEKEEISVKPENKVSIPENSYLISEMYSNSIHRVDAESYLKKRKLPIDGLYFCTEGDYRSRIIIPYYDQDGRLVYFNARHIGKAKLRYMGPPKSVGVGKSDVLFCKSWPSKGSKIHVTEGEFDALTLTLSGFNGFACGGKVLSDQQLAIIRNMQYKVCLCPDRDPTVEATAAPGFKGLISMASKLISAFIPVSFTQTPQGFKDWNEVLIAYKTEIVHEFINRTERPYDDLTTLDLLC